MLNGMLWIARVEHSRENCQSVTDSGNLLKPDSQSSVKKEYLKRFFHALSQDADMENLSIDSTSVWIHERSNSGKTTNNAHWHTN